MTTLPSTTSNKSSGALVNLLGNGLIWLGLVFIVLLIMFPFWWVIRTALTQPDLVYTNTADFFPVKTTLLNFERVLGIIDGTDLVGMGIVNPNISTAKLNLWLFMRNSFIFSGLIMLGQTIFSTMAAYAFARLRFPFRDQIFFMYLTGLMVPGIVLFIPNFVFIRQMGLNGTFIGMVAPFFLMTPFTVFFMRQFFLSLNKDLIEAATLDGATRFGIFWRVALPLVQGPILTIAILIFIQSWNEYLWPFLVGRDESIRVLTVALAIFRDQTPQGAPDWAGLMAGTAVAMIPTIIIFVFFGRKVVDSIQFSGFK